MYCWQSNVFDFSIFCHMIPYNDTFRRYLKPLSSGNEDEDQALGAKMLYLSKQVNQLKEQVEEQHLDRRSVCWKEVSEVMDFPQLDEERLRELTCGSYQLRLSSSYAQEHIEGDCAIHTHRRGWSFENSHAEQAHIIKNIPTLDKVWRRGHYCLVLQVSGWCASCWYVRSYSIHCLVSWVCTTQAWC